MLDDVGHTLVVGRPKIDKTMPLVDRGSFMESLRRNSVIPNGIKKEESFEKACVDFYKAVQTIIHEKNVDTLVGNLPKSIAIKYKDCLSKRSDERKAKDEQLRQISQKLMKAQAPYLRRAKAIKRILQLEKIVQKPSNKERLVKGFDGHTFVITTELRIERPIDYLYRVLCDALSANGLRGLKAGKNTIDDLYQMCTLFIRSPIEVLKESASEQVLLEELETLSGWQVDNVDVIYVESGGTRADLSEQSPGTRANYLMEFVVGEENTVPLLIDQPEDNIDNETIAGKMTEWFFKMKSERQVIVVTHDPNIVVNADAENIIVCKQVEEKHFEYRNAPLEDDGSLEAVVTILEGGKDALERRIGKYGN